jgi:hypothetical protein
MKSRKSLNIERLNPAIRFLTFQNLTPNPSPMERGAFCEREKPPLHRRGGWGDRRSGEVLKVDFPKKEITG